jgi:hypothetical protein
LHNYFIVKTKDQLKSREAHYIQTIKCVNKNIPGRTKSDWGKQNYKEHKKYYNEKGKQYYKDHKEYHKEKGKQYRIDNKEQICTKQNVKFMCECGGCYTYVNRIPHSNTMKHQNYINANYEWTYWWGDIQCTEQDYNISHFA